MTSALLGLGNQLLQNRRESCRQHICEGCDGKGLLLLRLAVVVISASCHRCRQWNTFILSLSVYEWCFWLYVWMHAQSVRGGHDNSATSCLIASSLPQRCLKSTHFILSPLRIVDALQPSSVRLAGFAVLYKHTPLSSGHAADWSKASMLGVQRRHHVVCHEMADAIWNVPATERTRKIYHRAESKALLGDSMFLYSFIFSTAIPIVPYLGCIAHK